MTKLSQLILVNTTLQGSVSTITVGNLVCFKYTSTYTTLKPRANSLICQLRKVECIIQGVLSESQTKNRKSVKDRSVFKKTSPCSSTTFSGEKNEDAPGGTCDPWKDWLSQFHMCRQSWLIFTCKMNSLCTNCNLCRNNVCFVNWVHRVSHKSSLPPREVLQYIYDFSHKCPLQALQDVF